MAIDKQPQKLVYKPQDLRKFWFFHKVCEFFDYDEPKALQWYNTPNPMFGGLSAFQMVAQGRLDKVEKYVLENIPKGTRR